MIYQPTETVNDMTTTTTTVLSKEQRDQELTQHFGLVHRVIRDKCRQQDVPEGAIEDLVADAVAHTWRCWESLCRRHPELPAKTRARFAARDGFRRARRGDRFGYSRPRGYVDALDWQVRSDADVGLAKARDAQAPPRSMAEDAKRFENLEAIIDKLPQGKLQQLARLLGYGRSRTSVREIMGLKVAQMNELIGQLEKLVPDALPPVEEGLVDDDEPRRRFCPVRRLTRALGIALEHNRCHRPDVVVHVDPFTGNIVLESR